MRIATVNVNGIRAAARKGMESWVHQSQPDVLLLQEVRAEAQTAAALLPGYETHVWPCRIKGRAGVAVALRVGSGLSFGQVRLGVAAGAQEPDVDSGRAAAPLTVISAYLHSGQVGTPRLEQKLAHLELVDARMAQLLAAAEAGGPAVVMAGDLNVVRSQQDIKNWKPNHNKVSGVLDEEIAHLEGWFGAGWVDVARALAGEAQGPYTWWSQRGKAFDNDAGWRIDYQVATPSGASRARASTVDRAPRYAERWSDHAPLVVDYDL